MSQKALVLEKVGQPLVLVERPIPEPKENEVLVKVAIAGINPHDGYVRPGASSSRTPFLLHWQPTSSVR